MTLGDLEPDWLDALARFEVPVLGVYGNHDDGHYLEAGNTTDVHLRPRTLDGVTFTGFEGCVRYKRDAPLQYDQREARSWPGGCRRPTCCSPTRRRRACTTSPATGRTRASTGSRSTSSAMSRG